MTTPPVMRALTPADMADVARLHDRVFGPGRFARTAYRVREGRPNKGVPLSAFCRCVMQGSRMIGALSLTEIKIGGTGGALLLGPIVVDQEFAGQGYGRGMIADAMEAARKGGARLVVLVGDAPYYSPLGFQVIPAGQIVLPGPVNPARLLAAELQPGALAEYRGIIGGR
jgi:predicted N-acetyltransferase YhbS